MNRIKNKLRSRTGASITFALLLFLVCAVLCSVILSAATAASGRMAGVAQRDQRYFAVTSACEMMRDIVGGEDSAVTIVKKTTTVSTTKYVDGAVSTDGSSKTVTNAYTVKTASFIDDYTDEEFKTNPITVKSTEAVVSTLMSASINIYKNSAFTAGDTSMADATSWPKQITIASSDTLKSALGENLTVDPLAVTIRADLDKGSGKLTLTVFNTTEDTGDRFTQIMVFGMNKTTGGLPQEESVSSKDLKTTTDGHISYNVLTTTTTYETTTYTWTLDSIETKMATPSET